MGQTRIASKLHYTDQTPSTRALYMQQNTFYYHPDHLGSTNWVTDHQGEGYEHFTYTPYGEAWVEEHLSTEIHRMTHRFTGQELDPETGLYAFPARNYGPRTSRWLSADPALEEYLPVAPTSDEAREHNQNLPGMGGVFNTLNLAVYHYGANNPLKYVDPDGRETRVFSLPVVGRHRHLFVAVKSADGTVTTKGLYPVTRPVVTGLNALIHNRVDAEVRTNDPKELAIAKAFFDGASEERLPNGGRHEAKIRGPEGIPEEAYDAMVLEAFDDYERVDDMYHALDGPNSNTAVDDVIESTVGSIPTIEGATQQNWGEQELPE